MGIFSTFYALLKLYNRKCCWPPLSVHEALSLIAQTNLFATALLSEVIILIQPAPEINDPLRGSYSMQNIAKYATVYVDAF